MKKYFSLLIIILPTILMAQEQRKVRFGLQVLPNIGWYNVSTNGMTSDGAKLSFGYGLMADFGIFGSENYFLHSGVNIIDFRGTLNYPDVFIDQGINQQANTIDFLNARMVEVPFSVKMLSDEIGHFSYYGLFGASLGFIVRGTKSQETIFGGKKIALEDIDILSGNNRMMNAFRAALMLGGGAEYNLIGSMKLFAGLQFQNGFTNILRGDYVELDPSNNQVVLDGSGEPIKGPEKKAQANFISLQLGLIF